MVDKANMMSYLLFGLGCWLSLGRGFGFRGRLSLGRRLRLRRRFSRRRLGFSLRGGTSACYPGFGLRGRLFGFTSHSLWVLAPTMSGHAEYKLQRTNLLSSTLLCRRGLLRSGGRFLCRHSLLG